MGKKHYLDGVEVTRAEKRAQSGITFSENVARNDRARIRRTLRRSFSQAELKAASKAGLEIDVAPTGKKHSGYYAPAKRGTKARAVIENPRKNDDVIHEVVHHLRRVDSSRTGTAKASPVRSKEEAATVAETAARAAKTRKASGYYDDVPAVRRGRISADAAYKHDRGVMASKKPTVGINAASKVNKNYNKTHIAKRSIFGFLKK